MHIKRSQRFRKRLRAELEGWRREGLIDGPQVTALMERYELDQLRLDSYGVLVNTVFLIGAVLIGCGITAFVVANWPAIPRGYKASLLLGAMLAVQFAGYYLWQIRRPARQTLGHSLVLLGTLLFGVNVGLFAQIFHVSGPLHHTLMFWALGAMLVAYAVQSVPNAVVAVLASAAWYIGYVEETGRAFLVYPAVAAAAFLPFCYLSRSAVVLGLALLAVAGALVMNTVMTAQSLAIPLLTLTLTALAVWCFGALHHRQGRWPRFGWAAASIGAAIFAALAYALSFYETAGGLAAKNPYGQFVHSLQDWRNAAGLGIPLALTFALAVTGGLMRPSRLPRMLVPVLAAGTVSSAALYVSSTLWLVLIFNTLAAVLGAYGICTGFRHGDRWAYWSGLGLVLAVILSRFFGYESPLTVKAAMFTAVGLLLILAGLRFERQQRPPSVEARGAEEPNA